MDFMRRLFGARQRTVAEEDPAAAVTELESVRAQASLDAGEARRRLRDAGRRHRRTFRLGADLHDAYRAAFVALHGSPLPPPEAVVVVAWEALGAEPDARILTMRAREAGARYAVVRSDDSRTGAGAGGELEALALLEAEAQVALVLVGGLDLVLRASFLDQLSLPASLPDASEVIVVLSEHAVASGLDTRAVAA